MTRKEATDILRKQGWDDYGIEAIVDALEEHDLMDDMTEDRLIAVSEDYMDR